jgi:hypothetical protein
MKGPTLSSFVRRHRIRITVAAAAAVVLVAVLAVLYSPYLSHGCGGMFSGMAKTATEECVGVIDDDTLLDPALRGLFQQIQQEDRAVAGSGEPYVKVVLLTPLSTATRKQSGMSMDQIRHSVQGSFTALWRINHERQFGDPTAAKVQLVLANSGSRQEYNKRVIDDVLAVSAPDHPLVAVVGLGSSLPGAAQSATALGGHVPVMSAVASADSFNATSIPGLRSVSPSTSDYVTALHKLIEQPKVGLSKAILVADVNNDPYVQSLAAAFQRQMRDIIGGRPAQSYHGGTVDTANATPQVFQPVTANICTSGADTILYAGRVADFEAFTDSLASRACAGDLAVLVGATGFQSAERYVDRLDNAHVTVLYTSSSDAAAWTAGRAGTPNGFAKFSEQFKARGYPATDLADGYAIAYHDALAAVAMATRLAAVGHTPAPADVRSQIDNLNLSAAVDAGSGTLTFSIGTDGRAIGKAVPYRQIGKATKFRLPDNLPPYITGS